MDVETGHVAVAVTLPVPDRYTYRVPESLVPLAVTGRRILVPFGQRTVTGYVLGPAPEPGPGGFKVKNILDALDHAPLFGPEMVPLFEWTADYYLHPLGMVIQAALPSGLTLRDTTRLTRTPLGAERLAAGGLNPVVLAVLTALADGPLRTTELRKRLGRGLSQAALNKLEEEGLVDRDTRLGGGTARPLTERFVALRPGHTPSGGESEARRRVAALLAAEGELSMTRLRAEVSSAASLVRAMTASGEVTVTEKPVWLDPLGTPVTPDAPRELTPDQATVVRAVLDRMDQGFRAYLLAGVTAAGKTEVYLHLAGAVLERGKTVLILVPEIALISQTERRFRARFGERVAILHSGLTASERLDQWRRIQAGHLPVVVGARSAVFAPLANIGLILVDEEHDDSYKQGEGLLYNGRDLAVVRARMAGAPVLLGSATPSLQSWHNTHIGKFTALRLTRRVTPRPLPVVEVVDLRHSRDERGARRLITPPLHQALRETLERGEQALIFLNRRGFASFPLCGDCGAAVSCRHCDVTLTYHRLSETFRCHLCGFTLPAGKGCPTCGASSVKPLGIGTERVEAAVRTLFPQARVARMDRDTTSHRDGTVKILKALKNRAVDILVGTQMIAKGHDFPDITLVGVICADLSLSFPDFRAGERTFQVLAQVAGRAGRGDRPGRVILQTYAPDHYSIQAARLQDFQIFFNTEIGFRRALLYPPFSRLVQIRISGRDQDKTREAALAAGEALKEAAAPLAGTPGAVTLLGPIEAAIPRVADRYRWQMLLKGRKSSSLRDVIRRARAASPVFSTPDVAVVVDVDPYFMT